VTAQTILSYDRITVGRLAEARAVVGDNILPIPFNGQRAYTLQSTGDTAAAAAIRRTLEATSDTTWMVHTARVYAGLATPDTSRVLSEMEAALTRRELLPQFVAFVDRIFDPIRHTARFAAIVRRAGLEGRGLTGPTGGRPSR
jgi:hypothetical protein